MVGTHPPFVAQHGAARRQKPVATMKELPGGQRAHFRRGFTQALICRH
jgi:hypothetical protein